MGRKINTDISSDQRRPQNHKLTRPGAFKIVLLNPRIPQNTGSIARLCAATGSCLDLINPSFSIDDRKLRRAGLDYWHLLDVRIFSTFEDWLNIHQQVPWLIEVGSDKDYTQAEFRPNDALMFGDEQDGIPSEFLKKWPDRHLSLPQQGVRSMNLAMVAGIVTFEALRQNNWNGIKEASHHVKATK